MNKIKKLFLGSSFLRVFRIIKKNPHIYLYTIILDFIFLALIMFVGKYFGSFIPQDPEQIMELFKTQTNLLLFVFIYPVIYYLIITFLYSIAKLSILNLIMPLYEKHKFTLKGLGKFYILNILILIIFFFTTLILLGILTLLLEQNFLKYLVLILAVPFIFFVYSIINISHTIFIKLLNPKDFQSGTRKGILKKSLNITFNKIPKYGMFIVWNIILTLIYLLLYNIIHLSLVFINQELVTTYISTYLKTFNIITIIFLYLVIAFNRIYFYERIDQNVLQ